jgi:hypothetical protein
MQRNKETRPDGGCQGSHLLVDRFIYLVTGQLLNKYLVVSSPRTIIGNNNAHQILNSYKGT